MVELVNEMTAFPVFTEYGQHGNFKEKHHSTGNGSKYSGNIMKNKNAEKRKAQKQVREDKLVL